MYRFLRHIFLCLLLGFSLTACDLAPDLMRDRLFVDANASTPYILKPATGTTPERLCIDIDDLQNTEGSGVDWLKRPEIDPATGQETGTEVGPIAYIMTQIETQLDAGIEATFRAISESDDFRKVVQAVMTIAVIFYGIAMISGVVPVAPFPIVVLTFKLTIIYALVTEYDTFRILVQDFFEGLVEGFISITAEAFTGVPIQDQQEAFEPGDEILAKLFSLEYCLMLFAVVTTGNVGFFYGLTLLLAIFGFLFATVRAVYIFILALVVRGLLYILAPFFITLALLKVTKSLFDGWLQQMISFTLQPVLLFCFLGIFFIMIDAFLGVIGQVDGVPDSTHICYMPVQGIIEGTDRIFYWWYFTNEDAEVPQLGLKAEIKIDLIILFTMLVLSFMMVLFGTWAVEVANHLSNGFVTTAGLSAPGWGTAREKVTDLVGGKAGKTARGPADPRKFVGAKEYLEDSDGVAGRIGTKRGSPK